MLPQYLLVFLISMVPLIELRGALPIALGMGLPAVPAYITCITLQRQRLVLHAVVGEIYSAFVIIQHVVCT